MKSFLSCLLVLSLSVFGVAGTLVIRNVTVIDMAGRSPKRGVTVVIEGATIAAVARSSRTAKSNQVIDGTGKFLIPGLWDMHVHVMDSDRMLPLFVANGVLGVRDMGSRNLDSILKWRDEAAKGLIISPRIITAGKVLDGVPQADPSFSLGIKDADEGRKTVRDLAAKRVDLIKVYDNLSRDAYFAIADEAKKRQLPLAGHVPLSISTIEASDAGQRSIEHLGKILEDSSDSKRLAAVRAEAIKDGDFFAFTTRMGRSYDAILETINPEKEKVIFEHFRHNETWQVPTLVVKYGRTFIDDLDAKGDARTRYVEASQIDYWKPQNGFFSRYRTPSYIASQKRYFLREKQLVGEMARSGVKIMTGTDTPNAYVIAGFSIHEELKLMVEGGMTPMQALMSATKSPAGFLGELALRGTIEPGKAADLVMLDADPLNDITNTTRINAVIQKGKLLTRADLDQILERVSAAAAKAR